MIRLTFDVLHRAVAVTARPCGRIARNTLYFVFGVLTLAVGSVPVTGSLIDVEIVSPQDATYEFINPPESLIHNHLQSDSTLYVLEEQLQFELTEQVWVDYLPSTRQGGYLPAGTMVDAYLVHFDPLKNGQGIRTRLAFDGPILGLISETETLGNSDALLGREEVEYGEHRARGIDGNDGTKVNVLEDGQTIGLNLHVTRYFDEARILVAPKLPVPEPVTGSLLLLGLFVFIAFEARRSP